MTELKEEPDWIVLIATILTLALSELSYHKIDGIDVTTHALRKGGGVDPTPLVVWTLRKEEISGKIQRIARNLNSPIHIFDPRSNIEL